MAAEVGGLLINLGLDVAAIRQDVGKANRELTGFRQKVDRQMGKAQRAFKKATSGVKGLAAALGAQQLGAAIGRTLSSFEEINRQARSLGASRETIQELQFAFRQFGLEQKDVTDALATVSDRADDALGGMQSFIDDFERFGIEVDSLRGKSPGELFRTVAQGISELDSEQKQVTAAVRLFGDEVGQRLLPLLNEGASGIDKYAQRARELGVVVSDELVKDSAKAAKDFRALKEVLTAQFASTVAENAEELSVLAKSMTSIAVVGGNAAAAVANMVAEVTKFQFMGSEDDPLKDRLSAQKEELEAIQESISKFQSKLAEEDLSESARKAYQTGLERQQAQLERTKNRIIKLQKQIEIEADRAGGGSGDGGNDGGGGGGGSRGSGAIVFPSMTRMGRRSGSNFQKLIQIQQEAAKETQKAGDTITNVQTNIQNNQVEVNQTFERTGEIVADSFRSATREGSTLRGVVQGLLRDLAQMQVSKAANNIGQSLTNALSSSFGSGGLMSDPTPGTAGRAAGGPVRQNETYMVGENGPELFTPGKSGAITPNDKMGGGGDTYNIDARGADQAAIARLERTIKAVNGSIERRALSAVGSQRQRSFRG